MHARDLSLSITFIRLLLVIYLAKETNITLLLLGIGVTGNKYRMTLGMPVGMYFGKYLNE
jgi:hypothetical protein